MGRIIGCCGVSMIPELLIQDLDILDQASKDSAKP